MRNLRRRAGLATAAATLAVALSAPAALAATIPGTPYGDALYGTNYADTIYGYGGADLIYGYGGNDTVYGGNDSGYGDKVLGGYGDDRLYGGNEVGWGDALYGESGNDRLSGNYGDDLLQGGYGYDFMDAGPGADRVNAQDGQKDTIVLRYGEGDVVYYDRGLDVLQSPASARGSAAMSAEEAMKAGKVKLLTEKAPKAVFGHTGRVLVEHEGEEKLVAEKDVKGHMAHGDHILDPTGRASAGEGRR